MRPLATWLIVGFVAALGLAATVTALVEKGDGKSAVSEQHSPPATIPPPHCRFGQLALTTEILGGSPFVVLT